MAENESDLSGVVGEKTGENQERELPRVTREEIIGNLIVFSPDRVEENLRPLQEARVTMAVGAVNALVGEYFSCPEELEKIALGHLKMLAERGFSLDLEFQQMGLAYRKITGKKLRVI